MKLSQTAAYALYVSVRLAQSNPNIPVPCSRLATEGQMPERFLLQVLRTLVMQGILRSTRGVEDGYRLGRSAQDISVLDVIEAVDGPIRPALPPAPLMPMEAETRLRDTLARATATLRRELHAIKLVDLLPRAMPSQR